MPPTRNLDVCPGTFSGLHMPGMLNSKVCAGCDKVLSSPRSASADDIAAAKAILGSVIQSHQLMKGLPGADRCPHALTGAGVLISDILQGGPWGIEPYRHHDYVASAGPMRDLDTSVPYCVCGNKPSCLIHARCDEETE